MVRRRLRWLPVVALAGSLVGCKALEVTNPNAPERERAFSDPATIIATASGTMKTFWNLRTGNPGLGDEDVMFTLSAMADSYTASWNNHQIRFYASYGPTGGADCPDRCAWLNNTASPRYPPIELWWYGAYSVLSSANDALFALRVAEAKPDLGEEEARTEVIAQMAQAAALAWVALNYDQGFIVLEDTDPLGIEVVSREEIRDKAIELFDKGIQLAKASSFETGTTWFGIVNSPVYTNLQLAKIMRTMQAELLAHFPRNAEENAQVPWSQVVSYASQGISSSVDGAPFDFTGYQDENQTFSNAFAAWTNDYTTFKVDTRVAHLLSTTQLDPWPGGAGNPQPVDGAGNPVGGVYGVDKRLGDGCFDAGTGQADLFGYGECAETANSGTDYMWSPIAIFNPARGQYHQSNIAHIRLRCLAGVYFLAFPDCPTGADEFPYFDLAFNDLLWAEGLIRSGGSKAEAATLINNSRVGRGGLPALTGGESDTDLLKALLYEQDVELIQFPGTAFYNRRRMSKSTYSGPSPPANQYTADGQSHLMDPEGPHVLNPIWKDTPRHIPIPAKDLALLAMEIYTFGGPGNVGGVSAPVDPATGARVRSVREIYADILNRGKGHRPRRH